MNVKKVVGKTEKEAVDKVKSLYGEKALILNIQKKQSGGLLGLFTKPVVVVTAAFNEADNASETGNITDDSLDKLLGDLDKYDIHKFEASLPSKQTSKSVAELNRPLAVPNVALPTEDDKQKEAVMQAAADSLAKKALEEISKGMATPAVPQKMNKPALQPLPKDVNQNKGLRTVPTAGHTPTDQVVTPQNKISEQTQDAARQSQERIAYLEKTLGDMQAKLRASQFEANSSRVFDNTVLQIFYEALVSQGVLEHAAKQILTRIEQNVADNKSLDISYVAASVYTEILKVIKKPNPIAGGADALFVFFAGPTGVGKTTTIAKLASRLVLEQNVGVGLMTADTYRIAAVEQLKTYAEILNLDIRVVYEKNDFVQSAKEFGETKDVVFVDTAGRSHKNKENLLDLKDLINVPVVSEKYLVLSMTTKYEDLVNIINTYRDIGKFKLILTKFDETTHYGSIFNLCHEMGHEVVYITTGQNVPDDIELLKPEKIAKALLGLDTGL